jgi:hypothetical protein
VVTVKNFLKERKRRTEEVSNGREMALTQSSGRD